MLLQSYRMKRYYCYAITLYFNHNSFYSKGVLWKGETSTQIQHHKDLIDLTDWQSSLLLCTQPYHEHVYTPICITCSWCFDPEVLHSLTETLTENCTIHMSKCIPPPLPTHTHTPVQSPWTPMSKRFIVLSVTQTNKVNNLKEHSDDFKWFIKSMWHYPQHYRCLVKDSLW